MPKTIILIIAWLCLGIAAAHAGWYESRDRGHVGWYGYQKYKKAEKAHGVEKKKEEKKRQEMAKWPAYKDALKMRPSELGRLIRRAREVAIGNPTVRNVIRWSLYRNAAIVKAERFAGVVAWVNMTHPGLAQGKSSSAVVPGIYSLFRAEEKEVIARLRKEKDRFAMILFVSGRAPLSSQAAQECRYFARETGWKLRIVNADRNPALASAVGVTYIPQAWVISRDKKIRPFSVMTGVISLHNLKRQVYRGLRVALGESPEGFGRPMTPGVVRFKEKRQSK